MMLFGSAVNQERTLAVKSIICLKFSVSMTFRTQSLLIQIVLEGGHVMVIDGVTLDSSVKVRCVIAML